MKGTVSPILIITTSTMLESEGLSCYYYLARTEEDIAGSPFSIFNLQKAFF